MQNYNTSVASRVDQLTKKTNPYMKGAATQGLQAANRRGLLNSSMAVQAAQQARVNAALPIAQQEATQDHQSQLQHSLKDKDLMHQKELQASEFGHRKGLMQVELDNQKALAAQGHGFSKELQNIDYGHKQGLMDQSNQYDMERLQAQLGSQKDLQQMQINSNLQMQANDLNNAQAGRDHQLQINSMNLASQEQANALAQLTAFDSNYMQLISNILNNTELEGPIRQQFLDGAYATLQSNQNAVQQMYNIQLDWGGSIASTSGDSAQVQDNSVEQQTATTDTNQSPFNEPANTDYSDWKSSGNLPTEFVKKYGLRFKNGKWERVYNNGRGSQWRPADLGWIEKQLSSWDK